MGIVRTTAELNGEIGIGKAGSIDSRYFPNVQPLPFSVRAKFMKALKAEDEGNDKDAAVFLQEAIDAENALPVK